MNTLFKLSLAALLAVSLMGCGDDDKKSKDNTPSKDYDLEACSAAQLADCVKEYELGIDIGYVTADDIACYLDEGKPVCAYDECDKGDEADECSVGSSSTGGTVDNYVCKIVKGGAGVYVWNKEVKKCSAGCNKEETDCYQTLVDDEGQECDASSRAPSCDNGIYSYCEENYLFDLVVAYDCVAKGYTGCFDVEGNKGCATTCTEKGATIFDCDDSTAGSGFSKLYTYSCVQASDGTLVRKLVGEVRNCSSCDNSGKCEVDGNASGANAQVGDECTTALFQERCDTDPYARYYCSSNMTVARTKCDEGEVCAVAVAANSAMCIKATDECSTEGATEDICSTDEVDGQSMQVSRKCYPFKNGKKYWVVEDYDYCVGSDNSTDIGCNAATAKCNEVED